MADNQKNNPHDSQGSPCSKVLAVDLDGTLITADSMENALKWMWKHKPLQIFWLMVVKGMISRSEFKWELYKQVSLETVPLNEPLVTWLQTQKTQGRKIMLISATPQFWVEGIATRLGELFDEVVGSTRKENRRGKIKAKYLIERFGRKGFDYVGNSQADIAVWKKAQVAYNVNPSVQLAKAAKKKGVTLTMIAENKQSDLMETWDNWLRIGNGVFWSAVFGFLAGIIVWNVFGVPGGIGSFALIKL